MSLLGRLMIRRETPADAPIEHHLRERGVQYEVRHHAPAYTAQELAEVEHIPGRYVAKVVMARRVKPAVICDSERPGA